MKRTPGLTVLLPVLAVVLAACGGGPSPAEVKAWQAGAGGKELVKIAQYLSVANRAVIGGETTTAQGGGIFLVALTPQAASQPSPVDGDAYKQEMGDLAAYGKALMAIKTDSDLAGLAAPLKKAQAVIDQHKGDWWAQKLNDAMKV